MDIVLASSNRHKLEEIKLITKEYGVELLTLNQVGLEGVEIEETGVTFEENALLKAKEISKLTGKIAMADDSGLSVDLLNGEPGVYSARYCGEDKNYDANNKKLLENMKNLKGDERKAKFVTVLAMVKPGGEELVVRGELKGKIAMEERGENGFGYDPLFIPEGYDETFAQMSSEEKNRMSHRAIALKNLVPRIESFLERGI